MHAAQTIVGLAHRAGAAPSRPTPIRGHDAGIQRKLWIRAPQASVLCQLMQIKVWQKPFLREIQRHGAHHCRALLARDAGPLVRAHVQAACVLDPTLSEDSLLFPAPDVCALRLIWGQNCRVSEWTHAKLRPGMQAMGQAPTKRTTRKRRPYNADDV